ncbi:MAG: glycoside hydrolase family 43 protein [Dehalococcoidia bacterium]
MGGSRTRRRLSRREFLRLAAAAGTTLGVAAAGGADAARGTGKLDGSERHARGAPEVRAYDTAELAYLAAARPSSPARPATVAAEVPPSMRYANPVIADDCPDPHVIQDGATFYLVATSHVLPAFPIRVSRDLVNWQRTAASVFTRDNAPAWASDHFWAPELHRVGGRYVCYYTARSRRTDRLCIGAAVAPTPFGPYRDLGRPLLEAEVTVLDPTFFRDDDGRQYLYWKADAADGDPSGPIRVQELTPDGLALVGDASEVLRNDAEWEGALVEGPSVIKRGGAYYLFYSGGAYDTPWYAVGVARSLSPTQGFRKRGEPILRSGARWRGPGHNSVVRHQEQDYIVFHAWEGERFRGVRSGLIDRLDWQRDGWPGVNDGTPREAWPPAGA